MQDPTAKQDNKPSRKGWLSRLARDQKGNTLAIVGAALVPLTAMIGSGVDMSRAYMAKQRLQAACDAASLAGRRAMTNDTLSTAVTSEATKFFNFNFPQGSYQTTTFTPSVTRPSSGVVAVSASTNIPTAIMKIFGFTSLPLSVTCNASLNFVNTDVLLVLDVTGSMADDVNGNSTSTVADQKITALKDAVMALYDALAPVQAQLAANNMRLRYGIVPYSSTVNVGSLIRAVNPAYLKDDVDYEARVANYTTPTYIGTPGTPEPPVEQTYGSSLSQSDCDKYGRNVSFSGFTPSTASGGGPPPAATWARAFSNDEASGTDWGWPGAPDTTTGGGDNRKSCRRRYVETDTTYITDYRFTNYSYVEESFDVRQYKLGNPVAMATGNDGRIDNADNVDAFELAQIGIGVTTTNVTWNGCIEERATNDQIRANSGYTIPSDAYDLNIDLVPTSDPETQWRPMFPQGEWLRSGSDVYNAAAYGLGPCPAASKRLDTWTRTDLQNYVNTLTPTGSTYHDIGMIWGARLVSTAGAFADGCTTYNGQPCSRHIIFMTDGQLAPSSSAYSAYGVEYMDQRVTASSSATNQYESHLQRFKMICNAAKTGNVGASIWVIAFGTTLSNDLRDCASNANQASTIANRTALIAKFTEIGNNIGALRLTQ
ncbi:MAG TPA: TadE/TadG family type IV pilus assembly protein [Allosphingosinicella sp.]